MSLKILQKGINSIPVDLGRRHYQHLGVSVGGPMDLHAALWANHLVDNAIDCAQIEICHGHFRGQFQATCVIAITGADMNATLNGHPITPWASMAVIAGDELNLAGPADGFYAYLAIAGGFNISPQLGSVCAVKRDGLGGLYQDGEGLQNDDVVQFDKSAQSVALKRTPPAYVPKYSGDLSLGVIECYQHHLFSAEQQQSVYQQSFEVSSKLNRQGSCLQGEAIVYDGPQLISEGIAYGAIQIPPDGQPIVLMRDRQSIGGYPKFGCVSALDTGKLAQRRPGATVRFQPVSLNNSQRQLKQLLRFFTQT
ncbi:MAG: biotin-dependent carboxylase-like uncharacterized protein [Saprospiraceae bacterium]|jgi:biotin-dependent carboxylase-like uncharacterized protein